MAQRIQLTEEIKRKIGALFMAGAPNEGVTQEYEDVCRKYYLGNFCVRSNHASSIEKACEINKALRKIAYETQKEYPLIGIDQEGGWVTRFYDGAGMISGAMSFHAAGADGDKMFSIGQKIGRILHALGYNLDNAPVLDINIDPANPIIGTRSYGDTPEKVAELGVGFAKGLESEGVLAAVKHFPGHGNVHSDSHLGRTVNHTSSDFLRQNDLFPFQKAFDEGIGAVMSAHISYTAFSEEPATLSPAVITDLLRNEMHFGGIVITDAIRMGAIKNSYPNGEGSVRAILAGCDQVLLYSAEEALIKEELEAAYRAFEDGRITEMRLDASIARITAQKERLHVADAAPNVALARTLVFDETSINENFEDKLASITCMKDDGILAALEGKKLLCAAPVNQARRGVEEANANILSFADLFKESFSNSQACVLTPEASAPPANRTSYDVAVIGIHNAKSAPWQLNALKVLKEKAIPTVAVLLGSPYDYQYVSDCNAVITCYEYTVLAAKATVAAMKKNEYKGQLPVKVE